MAACRGHSAALGAALLALATACSSTAGRVDAPVPASAATNPPAAAANTPPSAAAAPAVTAPAAALSPRVHLNIATQRLSSDIGMYLGVERGYFAEQGLDVDLIDIDSGQGAIPPLAARQLDVGVGSVSTSLFNAVARGIDIKVVATKGANGPSSDSPFPGPIGLVLGPELGNSGAVQDYRDLRGKSVALASRGAALEIIFERALRLGGLTSDDVEYKLLTYPDMVPALANRGVDVAMELEPFITQGRARGLLVPWRTGADLYPGQQTAAVIYGPSIVEKEGVGNRLMLAYTRALRDFNDAFGPKQRDRAALIAVLTKYTTVKDAALQEVMAKEYLNPDCYLNTDTIAADLQWYVANGYVPQAPDLSQTIDPRYCDYAIQQLGRYQP